ncbi:hypothetical protein FM111_04005 [Brevundimonas diminuta 3F5N]|uniref:Uncharacterized protein n=1 Tax=Brevundimonas diminuta 3F5N TaxID=1255603 RepID=A0A1R4FD48_BREDI|nr:hypothetical protein [Brevundimonas diminuta]SJM53712.1 hypothetical protein FM111_04005 [Brevundimonas diminuta 3F5N]
MNKSAIILASAALVLTGLGAAGWAAWNSTSAAHGGRASGSAVAIDVVPPVEPDLPVGSIMAVGELRGGYEHDPERLAALPGDDEPYVESAWLELMPDLPTPPTHDAPPTIIRPTAPPPAPQLKQDDYGFGFDTPQPDYAAEREARQSALKDPPAPDTRAASDSVFY